MPATIDGSFDATINVTQDASKEVKTKRRQRKRQSLNKAHRVVKEQRTIDSLSLSQHSMTTVCHPCQ